jgi:hypothetical protein
VASSRIFPHQIYQQPYTEIAMVGYNTLIGISPPTEFRPESLGNLIGGNKYEQLVIEKYPDLYRICYCENRQFDPKVCNGIYGCEYGMGLAQLIRSTWNMTLERMKKDQQYIPEECNESLVGPISSDKHEAIFKAECNLLVADFLYRIDGNGHWGTATTSWGSYACWSKYEIQTTKILYGITEEESYQRSSLSRLSY